MKANLLIPIIVAIISIVFGYGVSASLSTARIESLESKLDSEVLRIELRNDKDYDIMMEMSRVLVRIETKVDDLRENHIIHTPSNSH